MNDTVSVREEAATVALVTGSSVGDQGGMQATSAVNVQAILGVVNACVNQIMQLTYE